MNIKHVAMLFAPVSLLGVSLSLPSAQAKSRHATRIQVECDEIYTACVG
jgi:hypothetical protein